MEFCTFSTFPKIYPFENEKYPCQQNLWATFEEVRKLLTNLCVNLVHFGLERSKYKSLFIIGGGT